MREHIRPMLWGAAVGVVLIALAGMAYAALGASLSGSASRGPVMLVLAAHSGQNNTQIAQMVAIVDTTGDRMHAQPIDPLMNVSIPSSSYDHLRDAYPFGGATGVAQAYANATGAKPLPVISVSESGFAVIVSRLGGVTVVVPWDVNVFDGRNLYTFAPGEQKLQGPQLIALLGSTDALAKWRAVKALRGAIATGLAKAVAEKQPDLSDLVASGAITSSLSKKDLVDVGARLRRFAPSITIVSPTK